MRIAPKLTPKPGVLAARVQASGAAQDVVAQDVVAQDVVAQDVVARDVVARDVVARDVVALDVVASDAVASKRTRRGPAARGWLSTPLKYWLEACTAVGVAVVVVLIVRHAWTAPLLLDPLLAVPPALAGIGAATVKKPLAYGAVSMLAALATLITATSASRDLPEVTLIAVAVVTAVSAGGTALTRKAMTASLTDSLTASIRASIDISTRQQLANAVSVAEVAQRAVLRPLPAKMGDLRLGVVYLAAAADAKVGGDLYEVVSTPHGIRVIVGDVRGKGLGAVEVAADVLGMYREIAYEVHTLPELARRLDAGLARRYGEHEEFVTAVLAEIDPAKGRLTIFNCGHPPAMLISHETVQTLEAPANAPPLGLVTLGDSSGAGMVVDFKPNDQLLLYTDGVTEARDKSREFYPLQERLAKLAAGKRRGDLLELLRADLLHHVGAPLDDDAALLLIRAPTAWPAAPRGRHSRE
jgi:hypothetical protein